MSKLIQYIGTPEQINKAIIKLASDDTKLIDLTGDKELERLFSSYYCLNPLEDNIKNLLEDIKKDEINKYIINDCHILKASDLKPLIDLGKEKELTIVLFSNFDPLDLEMHFSKGLSINEPLPYYDYSSNYFNLNGK